ncbi:acyltransferase family protein [Flavobacterium caeni]|uniref:Peptidoglycan/LPS O-acetylase OafA/YrhL, contains acyltransferase and SGNH-hydrolase domains n=1 Tax=Flavobacterium caeni TaxID=490189 RepID=A0A1G5HI35_9FLAO|nr:acyltransferase [Flavobacterium caeni]SCY63453.1 Peptidoglycan/LPS O-acetylase OafA/YrhL, contains acyltransferase and SGNH-hydrolase domains [Flavobacterium caeni]
MPDNQLKEKNKIFGLDLMRVLAILLVLAAHILWIYQDYSNLLTKAINFSGFIGVELFFVLSGFLIGKSLLKLFVNPDYNYKYASIFLRRRWFRIMPNYLLVLILNIAVFSYLGYQIEGAWKYFFFLQNFIHPMLPFFPESWSMSIKEIPYFLLPFAFLLLARIKGANRNRLFLLTIIGSIALVMLAKVEYHLRTDNHTLAAWNVSLRSVALYRIDAVMLGILASWIQYNFLHIWTKSVWFGLVLSQMILGALAYLVGFVKLPIEQYPVFWNLLFLPLISVAAALMLPFFAQWKSAPDALRKPVQFLGAVSYSVYLLHYSFVLYLMKYFIDTYYMDLWQLHTFTVLYLTVTFVVSWCLYEFFERPLMKIRDERI